NAALRSKFQPPVFSGNYFDYPYFFTSDARSEDPRNAHGCNEDTTSSMILPVWLYHQEDPDNQIMVYALLDPASNGTFIKTETLNKLGRKGKDINLRLNTMHGSEIITTQKITGLKVEDLERTTQIELPKAVYCRSDIPSRRSEIPRPEMANKWDHLCELTTKLNPYQERIEIGLLIGSNCPKAIKPQDVIPGNENDPYAIRTLLGWGIIGPVSTIEHNDLVQDRFSFTCDAAVKYSSVDDQTFLRKVSEGIHLREDGHYEIPLPFKENDIKLPNNRKLASYRLQQLKSRFEKDDKYKKDYVTFVNDMIKKGYAERVPPSEVTTEEGKCWYIPHHGVYHPKKPSKIRVVFDCSSQYKGESINKYLLQGPDLTNKLIGVLTRFRQETVAFTTDIEAMFHQVKVTKECQDFLRFLWWPNGETSEEIETYRMTVHLFGATSSPGCSNFALKRTADDNEQEIGKNPAEFLRKNFYVDDGLKSVSSNREAVTLIRQAKEMCGRGGFNLCKFISNRRKVIEEIPQHDRADAVKDLDLEALPIERTLGVQWSIEMFQTRRVCQCSYLRLANAEGKIHCSLVMGKARVNPLKTVSIPRLELTAALVSAKVNDLMKCELEYDIKKETFWTDSQITLGYIGNDSKRFHVYVANRVAQIRSKTTKEQWNYIDSSSNPADDGSRGMSAMQFLKNPRWITGPRFLWQPEDQWIEPTPIEVIPLEDPEVKQSCFSTNVKETWSLGKAMETFSTWQGARSAVAICLIYRLKLLNKVKVNQSTVKDNISSGNKLTVTVENLRKAEIEIYRSVQLTHFEKEVHALKVDEQNTGESCGEDILPNSNYVTKSSPLYRLKPFRDALGILRVGGRIKHADSLNALR
ncbi:Hypothetical predicted protein, partial [Paramuricea clavata]